MQLETMYYDTATRGFYEEAQDGRIAISFADYTALLQSQADGFVILPDEHGHPISVNPDTLLTLPDFIKRHIAKLEVVLNERSSEPITFNGNSFKTDDAQLTLYTRLLAPGTLPADFKLRSIDNVNVSMTYADLQALGSAILERNQAYFWHFQALKAQCKSVTSVEELTVIEWGT